MAVSRNLSPSPPTLAHPWSSYPNQEPNRPQQQIFNRLRSSVSSDA